jgi:hypothetical protein
MPVISQMFCLKKALLLNSSSLLEKKSTNAGVISSYKVQPYKNHSLFRNVYF